ncbi:hypothetical protein [Dysosmobacter sp. Sow4_B12]|uniref:hypothetical protein n=1 Tax=Dysosmobacter sp. Sow4_B12 TaxID=3438777 RepID=UPI003F9083E6
MKNGTAFARAFQREDRGRRESGVKCFARQNLEIGGIHSRRFESNKQGSRTVKDGVGNSFGLPHDQLV